MGQVFYRDGSPSREVRDGDVALEMSASERREFLARVYLGLSPAHDLLFAIKVLHDEGRDAFERVRGPRCEFAHQWKPSSL